MPDTVTPPPERIAVATDAPKSLPVVGFKAAAGADADAGEFHAFAAVMGNIDSHGDIIDPGFFTDSLKSPAEGGLGQPPIVWSHDWMTPPIGASLDTKELGVAEAQEVAKDLGATLNLPDTATGVLYSHARMLVKSDEDHATARAVWAAMKAEGGDGLPPLREFSFGYRTIKADWEEVDPDTLPPELQWTGGLIRHLVKGWLDELGPTLRGANGATHLLGTKSRELVAAIKRLEVAGVIPSDEAATLRAQVGDTPAPRPAPGSKAAGATAEVEARIAELKQLRPPGLL